MTLPALLAIALSGVCGEGPLPDGNALARGLLDRQKSREEALADFAYSVVETREGLDKRGIVKHKETLRYEVFHVKGFPVRTLIARDGRVLTGKAAERESDKALKLAAELRSGKAAREQPGVRLSAVLERYEFETVGRVLHDGRCLVIVEFAAQAGTRKIEGDKVLRRLAGRLFLDPDGGAVARAEIHNTETLRFALGIGASVSAFEFRADFDEVNDGVWLPSRIETQARGKQLLVKGFSMRHTLEFSEFRRFSVEAEQSVHLPLPDEAPSGEPETAAPNASPVSP